MNAAPTSVPSCEWCDIATQIRGRTSKCGNHQAIAEKRCSFCGQPQSESRKVIVGVRASICGECAATAVSACLPPAPPAVPTMRHCAHVMRAWIRSQAEPDDRVSLIAARYHLPEGMVRIIVANQNAMLDELRSWALYNGGGVA